MLLLAEKEGNKIHNSYCLLQDTYRVKNTFGAGMDFEGTGYENECGKCRINKKCLSCLFLIILNSNQCYLEFGCKANVQASPFNF